MVNKINETILSRQKELMERREEQDAEETKPFTFSTKDEKLHPSHKDVDDHN